MVEIQTIFNSWNPTFTPSDILITLRHLVPNIWSLQRWIKRTNTKEKISYMPTFDYFRKNSKHQTETLHKQKKYRPSQHILARRLCSLACNTRDIWPKLTFYHPRRLISHRIDMSGSLSKWINIIYKWNMVLMNFEQTKWYQFEYYPTYLSI